ncbi:Isocitrate dehydrogenase [NADP] [Capsicum chinense]|nr:Isocitrate dehydrogenase [NADP] [Capsicum chinense]
MELKEQLEENQKDITPTGDEIETSGERLLRERQLVEEPKSKNPLGYQQGSPKKLVSFQPYNPSHFYLQETSIKKTSYTCKVFNEMPKRDLHVYSLDSSTIDINNEIEEIEDLFLDVFYRDTESDVDALEDWFLNKAPSMEDKSNKGVKKLTLTKISWVKTRNKKDIEAGAVELFMQFQLYPQTLRKPEDMVLANEKEKHNGVSANQWESGDEMTRVIWKLIKDKLILPFLELDIKYFILGLHHRDAIDDKVTIERAKATLKYNVAIKCATITPDEARMKKFNLKHIWKRPYGTNRNILNGMVFREPILCKNIPRLVPGWSKLICIDKHSFSDQYRATDTVIQGAGKLKLVFVPEGTNQKIKFEVCNFTGAGGVAPSMYSTDEYIFSFTEAFMNMVYQKKWSLYLRTKNTILEKYDERFKDIFQEVYEAN